jgi:CheY-like chemotaxis protein
MTASSATTRNNPRPRIIFVVEDDPSHRQICERVLREAGYLVLTAEDGSAVSGVLATTEVDLLMIDMFMPEQDGFETIAAVRSRHPDLLILAMSGGGIVLDPKAVLQQVKKLGANATLTKPFSDKELLRAVEACLTDAP